MIHIAAAIIRAEDKILICQRGAGGSMEYLWEFPGGKLEPSENARDCVIRECREELDIDISAQGIFTETTHTYPEGEMQFTFFDAVIVGGQIRMNVHLDYQWVDTSSITQYNFCPADVPVIEQLCRAK